MELFLAGLITGLVLVCCALRWYLDASDDDNEGEAPIPGALHNRRKSK